MTTPSAGFGFGNKPAATAAVLAALALVPACVEDVEVLDTTPDVALADRTLTIGLWAHDPLRQTVDLLTGDHGIAVEGGTLVNRNSHLGFGLPNPGLLEIGIQSQETGLLLDLGPDDELAAALGTDSGFVGLARSGDAFNHAPGNALFDELDRIARGEDGGPASRLVPEVGHVLVGALVREAGSESAAESALIVKILVVDHRPDTEVVLRWSVLAP